MSKENESAPSGNTTISGRTRLVASGAILLLLGLLAFGSPLVRAQIDTIAVGSIVRVVNTDGEPLNLRSGPSADLPIVVGLAPDETLTVLGAAQIVGETRWLPVRTAGEQFGWISDRYVVPVVSLVAVVPSPSPEPPLADVPAPAEVIASVEALSPPPSPMPLTVQDATPVEARAETGRPLEVEAKVKFPEAKTRHQEVTIWVTRNGAPVPDAMVTIFTEDDEDEPVRELKPTDDEGRTWREFALGQQKGSIELVISAVAPDGGKGRTSVTYFRR